MFVRSFVVILTSRRGDAEREETIRRESWTTGGRGSDDRMSVEWAPPYTFRSGSRNLFSHV